jgi:hypothetical protein
MVLHNVCWFIDTSSLHLPKALHSISNINFLRGIGPTLSPANFFEQYSHNQNLTIASLNRYMNQSPRQVGPAPQQGGCPHTSPALAHYTTPSADRNGDDGFLNHMISTPESSGGLHESCDPGYGAANDLGQYHSAYYSFGAERSDLHNRQASEAASPFAGQNDEGLLHGIANYAVGSSPGTQNRGVAGETSPSFHSASPSYLKHQMQIAYVSASHQAHPSPQLQLDYTAPVYEPTMERHTKYIPFRNLFHDAHQARDHRRRETLFGRAPYIQHDETITEVENDRANHVRDIYNAMTSGHLAQDNKNSIAMKRWAINAHYPPDLVEAYAHKVFDCLLQQAKEGFRGWEHNDYVADERKGDDVDREVNCASRLNNVIEALEREKTICEDVMNSACQIRMFVNAPRAYANRKHQNRVGNSKRGKGKDTADAKSRPTKSQRTGGKRTRAYSSTAREMPSSRDSSPQHQQAIQRAPSATPYYSSPAPHNLSLSPASASYSAPQLAPLHRPTMSALHNPFTQHLGATNPVPTSSLQVKYAPQSYTPHMVNEPAIDSPSTPQSRFPPTVISEDVKLPVTSDWQDMIHFGETSGESLGQSEMAVDPQLSDWSFPNLTPCEAAGSANMSDQHLGGFVNPAHIQYSLPGCAAGRLSNTLFGQIWSRQKGVQPMPLNDEETDHQNCS